MEGDDDEEEEVLMRPRARTSMSGRTSMSRCQMRRQYVKAKRRFKSIQQHT